VGDELQAVLAAADVLTAPASPDEQDVRRNR
jgi:hypothetical protein